MKKLLYATLLLSLAAVSCDIVEFKNPADSSSKNVQWGQVSFALSDPSGQLETRSTSPAAETAVTNLQVLVYNSSGNLVAYANANSGTVSATVPLNIAGHTVYAVTNVTEDLSGCSSPSALTSKMSYLKDNTSAGLHSRARRRSMCWSAVLRPRLRSMRSRPRLRRQPIRHRSFPSRVSI